MANFTMADLKRMREQREQRISEVKAEANNESKEYLLQANLAKGSTLWFPKKDKPEEVEMRIVDFMVTKEDNVAGDSVGKFTAMRANTIMTTMMKQKPTKSTLQIVSKQRKLLCSTLLLRLQVLMAKQRPYLV